MASRRGFLQTLFGGAAAGAIAANASAAPAAPAVPPAAPAALPVISHNVGQAGYGVSFTCSEGMSFPLRHPFRFNVRSVTELRAKADHAKCVRRRMERFRAPAEKRPERLPV